jgi:hypothetical protein
MANFLSALWQRELANTAMDKSFAQQVGSIAPDFGFQRYTVDGIDGPLDTFGGKVLGKPGAGNPNAGKFVAGMGGGALQPSKSHALFDTAAEASLHDDSITSRMARKVLGTDATGKAAATRGAIFRFANSRNPALLLSGGFALYAGVSSLARGEGIGAAGFAAAKDYAAGALFTKGLGILATPAGAAVGLAAVGAGIAAYGVYSTREYGNMYLRSYPRSSFNSPSVSDSVMASTMRQRAVMSMQQSKMNAFRNLSNEATFAHQPRSRYGNSYQGLTPSPVMGY